MINLHNIDVHIDGIQLLHNVSTRVEPGTITAIVGPNGAGKSTLLRVASGDLGPTNGQVVMEDRLLASWSVQAQAKRRAVLPQQSTLGFPFSVLDVVLMGRMPHARAQSDDWQIAQAALQATAVSHLAERSYPTLSGGEQQRVQMARVLAQIWEPPDEGARYLLLDESTASLDLHHQHGLLRLARQRANEHIGVLVVLHDLNLAAQYADRIVVLTDGQLLAEGTPTEVLTPDCIQQAFSLPVLVTDNPCVSCPLVVPTEPPTSQASDLVAMPANGAMS